MWINHSFDSLYLGLTSTAPFALALIARRHDGRVVVGAAFEDQLSIVPLLDQIKQLLRQSGIQPSSVTGWIDDDAEDWVRLAERADDALGIRFQGTFEPSCSGRQALHDLLSVQKGASSRFEIDKGGPGAGLLAAAIGSKAEHGVINAVGNCLWAIERDFPNGVTPGNQQTRVVATRPRGIFGNRF